MKQIILASLVALTFAGSAQADDEGWDYFWGTTVSQAFDPKLNGWDDFWYQCQDPTKTAGDCVGTVAAGIGLAIAAPIIVTVGVISAASVAPAAATAVLPLGTVIVIPAAPGAFV